MGGFESGFGGAWLGDGTVVNFGGELGEEGYEAGETCGSGTVGAHERCALDISSSCDMAQG